MRVGLSGSANLIVHQSIVNIFHQVIYPLHILRVVEESHKIILDFH